MEFNPFFCLSISKIDYESAYSFAREKKKKMRNTSKLWKKSMESNLILYIYAEIQEPLCTFLK